MTDASVPSIGDALEERSRLLATAFRLLGTTADAEDAVQEAYARWYRLSDVEQADIRNPAAWLTTVVGRICLDVLGSARARREQYVGPWLPEPRPSSPLAAGHGTSVDPADRVSLDDEVTSAVMVVLDSLTPAERVSFVLHDVFGLTFDEVAQVVGRTSQACRTLASAARRDIRDRRVREGSREDHERIVHAFLGACATGDLQALLPLLDPDVTISSDGGGVVRAARNPVHGADRVGRVVLGLLAKDPTMTVELEDVEGRTAVVMRREGAIAAITTFGLADGLVKDVWIVLNPAKLVAWG